MGADVERGAEALTKAPVTAVLAAAPIAADLAVIAAILAFVVATGENDNSTQLVNTPPRSAEY